MKTKIEVFRRNDNFFVSFFEKSAEGYPISKCKTDVNINLFVDNIVTILKGLFGLKNAEGYAIITAPKRRHKTGLHFVSKVCRLVAQKMGMTFYEDTISCKTKKRINPEFKIETEIKEKDIIWFDDILTTGSTMKASMELLNDKNVVYLIGINNA